MSAARDFLAAVQERADAATDGPWEAHNCGHPECGNCNWVARPGSGGEGDDDLAGTGRAADAEFIAAARTDVPRLVAALTAALDLAGGWMRSNDGHATPVERRRAKCGQAMEAAITDALTPEENDS